jgi:dolichyl-diphosphooligosaccharide--protein glycosyltransferase
MAFSKMLSAYIDPNIPDVDLDLPGPAEAVEEETEEVTHKKTSKAVSTAPKPTSQALTSTKNGIYSWDTRLVVLGPLFAALVMFVKHSTWVTSNAYSSPSVVLSTNNRDGSTNVIDDFRAAYKWLNENTKEDAVIASWWDYGYQIAGESARMP